jgi:general nucleoside transport system permease protein
MCAIAAWGGLMSIGAEGQIYLGAVGATAVALALPAAANWQVLPLMFFASCMCGALWSGVPGLLRARFGVNETIVTLLLNYVAILLVEYLIHGPWQDPESFSWPQTASFSQAAQLPRWSNTRLHLGICFGLVIAVFFWITLPRTRVGFILRVIGENPRAASYAHYPVVRYLIVAMLFSGAVAALAGLGQVSAIEGRLRTGLSPGYGYTGFLVSWLARHHPVAIVVVAILMGGLLSGSDSLQLSEKLPFATVNILQGFIFFFLLGSEYFIKKFEAVYTVKGVV